MRGWAFHPILRVLDVGVFKCRAVEPLLGSGFSCCLVPQVSPEVIIVINPTGIDRNPTDP